MHDHRLRIFLFSLLPLFVVANLASANLAFGGQAIGEMATAAERLLDSLDEGQRGKAVYVVTSEERQNRHFLPDNSIKPDGLRYGLPIKDMTEEQRIFRRMPW